MAHKSIIIFFLVYCFLLSCTVKPNPIEPTPVPDEPGDCEKACNRLSELQCPGWDGSFGVDDIKGTQDDVSCLDVCLDLSGLEGINLHPGCVSQIVDCQGMGECFE